MCGLEMQKHKTDDVSLVLCLVGKYRKPNIELMKV